MPETKQYDLSLKELTTLIVKECGVHEGHWQLLVNFNMAAGNFGMDATTVLPGSITAIKSIGILRVDAISEQSPMGFIVDAAEANPRKSAK